MIQQTPEWVEQALADPALKPALVALAQVFAYYNHNCTDFERNVWVGLLKRYGPEELQSFLAHHMSSSRFRPMIEDAQRFFEPGRDDVQSAMLQLSQAVSKYGPYWNPVFSDPAIAEAVSRMGGWAEINRQMPDPVEDRHAYREFGERFAAAYKMASSDVARGLALSHAPVGLIGSDKPTAAPRAALAHSGSHGLALPAAAEGFPRQRGG